VSDWRAVRSKKARCRIVSVKNENLVEKTCAEVQLLDGQECPWLEELTAEQVAADPNPENPAAASHDTNFFNMEMCDERVQTPLRVARHRHQWQTAVMLRPCCL